MSIRVKINSLVDELAKEAYEEGYQRSLYSHHNHFHTIEQRDKYRNHEAIVGEVKKNIEKLLEEIKK